MPSGSRPTASGIQIRPGIIRTDMIATVGKPTRTRRRSGSAAPHGRRPDVAKAVRAIADGLLDTPPARLSIDGGFHLRNL
jgi:hypothetical protein